MASREPRVAIVEGSGEQRLGLTDGADAVSLIRVDDTHLDIVRGWYQIGDQRFPLSPNRYGSLRDDGTRYQGDSWYCYYFDERPFVKGLTDTAEALHLVKRTGAEVKVQWNADVLEPAQLALWRDRGLECQCGDIKMLYHPGKRLEFQIHEAARDWIEQYFNLMRDGPKP